MKNISSGFSLIELMITIALCALVVTLTVINVSFLHRGTVYSEVDRLYAACMYLQQCALSGNQDYMLEFDEKKNEYSFDGRVERLEPPVRFGFTEGVKGPPSSPRNNIKSAITFPGKRIMFYSDGVISSGTVYLTDGSDSVLYALSNGIAHVSHLRKYSYNDTWVLLP